MLINYHVVSYVYLDHDGKVIPEVKDSNKASQLWIKGEENAQEDFTLQHYKTLKFLTAISASGLEIKGG